MFRRYLTAIGLIQEDDMSAKAESQINSLFSAMFTGGSSMGRRVDPDGVSPEPESNSVVAKLDYTMQQVDAVLARLVALRGAARRPGRRLLATLTPQQIVAALPPETAAQVAVEIARRGSTRCRGR